MSKHDARLALRLEDGEFRAAFERAQRDIASIDAIGAYPGSITMTIKSDGVATIVLDSEGQGYVEVEGQRTHSMWACAVCGIPTGGPLRECATHGAHGTFLKHIRERAIGDV